MSSPTQKPGSTGSTPIKHNQSRKGTSPGNKSTPVSTANNRNSASIKREASTPDKSTNKHTMNTSPHASSTTMASEEDIFFMPEDPRPEPDDGSPDLEDPEPNHPLGPLIRLRAFVRHNILPEEFVWAVLRTREPVEKLMRAWARDEPLDRYSFTAYVDDEVTKATIFLSPEDTPEELGLEDGDNVLVVAGRPEDQPEVGTFANIN